MNALTIEQLWLEVHGGHARLSMRGKTVTIESRHSFDLVSQGGGHATLTSETEVGRISWPLRSKEADEVWNELFKEVPDARN